MKKDVNLIIVRGIPGSGKSTFAKKLAEKAHYVHMEADMYFIDPVTKEYKFDINNIMDAHAWCQTQTMYHLQRNWSVVVSNTFTTIKELRPYFDIAKNLGIVPTVLLAQGNFKNVHNVPEKTFQRMKARFQYDISELYDELLNVETEDWTEL
jgi:predicted kinase